MSLFTIFYFIDLIMPSTRSKLPPFFIKASKKYRKDEGEESSDEEEQEFSVGRNRSASSCSIEFPPTQTQEPAEMDVDDTQEENCVESTDGEEEEEEEE